MSFLFSSTVQCVVYTTRMWTDDFCNGHPSALSRFLSSCIFFFKEWWVYASQSWLMEYKYQMDVFLSNCFPSHLWSCFTFVCRALQRAPIGFQISKCTILVFLKFFLAHLSFHRSASISPNCFSTLVLEGWIYQYFPSITFQILLLGL